MKVYIAGPMSGLLDFNYPAFRQAEEALALAGHEPITPAGELIEGWGYADYLRRSLRLLLDAEAIHLLDGWQHSRGAVLEANIAEALNMPRIGSVAAA